MGVVLGNMHVDAIVVEAAAVGLELGHERDQKAAVELLGPPSTARFLPPRASTCSCSSSSRRGNPSRCHSV